MTQDEARQLLITLCQELLAKRPGQARFSFDELADIMAKRFCHSHLAHFADAWTDQACKCGQAICPDRLRRAIRICIQTPLRQVGSQNAPTTATVH